VRPRQLLRARRLMRVDDRLNVDTASKSLFRTLFTRIWNQGAFAQRAGVSPLSESRTADALASSVYCG
jgi:hypothetical protein